MRRRTALQADDDDSFHNRTSLRTSLSYTRAYESDAFEPNEVRPGGESTHASLHQTSPFRLKRRSDNSFALKRVSHPCSVFRQESRRKTTSQTLHVRATRTSEPAWITTPLLVPVRTHSKTVKSCPIQIRSGNASASGELTRRFIKQSPSPAIDLLNKPFNGC